jgi:hypothetical protein
MRRTLTAEDGRGRRAGLRGQLDQLLLDLPVPSRGDISPKRDEGDAVRLIHFDDVPGLISDE